MPTFQEVLHARYSRRDLLKSVAAFGLAGVLPGCATASAGTQPVLTFAPIAVSTADSVRVPPGYEATVLYRWGDAVGSPAGTPEFYPDASNFAADQALQAGMHHDGMHFYPLPPGTVNSSHGLLAVNHEYADTELLYADGMRTWNANKVEKCQNAVGVSVIEVRQENGKWSIIRPSRFARRITALTPCRVAGPASGHALMRTASDPQGVTVRGTACGCAHGWTPWGTYLTCEENIQYLFEHSGAVPADLRRFQIPVRNPYRWAVHDGRFDAARNPHEPNRFGWVVEIDPFDPQSVPVKRTALGRFMHEGAACSAGADGRLAFYMGDDQAFEYVYKFVTARAWNPADRAANRDLLDAGTLYVARFNADGSGEWLPLVHGRGPLTAANGFRDQGEVVIRARFAGDALGATKMDRPEWIMPHPVTREVFGSCTNNAARGSGRNEGPNAANPRANNVFGHILRWREANDDPAATSFGWEVFVLAGTPARGGNIKGDLFGSPDALWIDSMGTLWVQTDGPSLATNRGDYAGFGNNQMLAVDPAKGVFKRFLTGPRGCEITGFHATADNRTAFVNIQHPGEGWRNNPREVSNWPDFDPQGRPRSATVVIRRSDGGIIGT